MKRKKQQPPEIHAEDYLKVLYWFFAFPDQPIGLSDLSDATSIAKTTANRVVTQLAQRGTLTIEKLSGGKVWRIKAKNDATFAIHKIAYNLETTINSGILQEIPTTIPNPRAIVLFGSYRKGEDTEKSDLDIAIEVIGDKDIEIKKMKTIKFGYRENVPVNLHIFSRNKINLNLFANIANGIVLQGFLEVRP